MHDFITNGVSWTLHEILAGEQSITSIVAGTVFSVMFFSGMIGRIALAAISDVLYKESAYTFIYSCLRFYRLDFIVSNEYTYNNEWSLV